MPSHGAFQSYCVFTQLPPHTRIPYTEQGGDGGGGSKGHHVLPNSPTWLGTNKTQLLVCGHHVLSAQWHSPYQQGDGAGDHRRCHAGPRQGPAAPFHTRAPHSSAIGDDIGLYTAIASWQFLRSRVARFAPQHTAGTRLHAVRGEYEIFPAGVTLATHWFYLKFTATEYKLK